MNDERADFQARQRYIEQLRREAAQAQLEADMLQAETEMLIETGQLKAKEAPPPLRKDR